jgi:hypothetical protein
MDAKDNPDHGEGIYNGVKIVTGTFVPGERAGLNKGPLFPALTAGESDSGDH